MTLKNLISINSLSKQRQVLNMAQGKFMVLFHRIKFAQIQLKIKLAYKIIKCFLLLKPRTLMAWLQMEFWVLHLLIREHRPQCLQMNFIATGSSTKKFLVSIYQRSLHRVGSPLGDTILNMLINQISMGRSHGTILSILIIGLSTLSQYKLEILHYH